MIVELAVEGRDPVLRLHDEFEPRSQFELRFLGAEGYTFTAEALCTLEHIEAYDRVVELASSRWGEEIASHRTAVGRPALHHYRVYLEGSGAYDVLAEAFLPDGAPPTFGTSSQVPDVS